MSTATGQVGTISLVIIPSTDQDKAIDFYVGSLGFEKRTDVPFGGRLPLGRGVPARRGPRESPWRRRGRRIRRRFRRGSR